MRGLEYLAILRKRWLYVVVPVIVGLAVAVGLSYTATPTYNAKASVYFSLPSATSANDLFQGSNYTQKQLASFAGLATTPVVLGPVIDKLHLETTPGALAGSVSAISSSDTVIVQIQASNTSPTTAADVANAVADQLGVVVRGLSPKSEQGRPQIEVQTVTPAVPPTAPSTPRTKINLVAGGVGGLFIGLLLAFARERLDNRVRTADDLPSGSALGTIRFDKAARKQAMLVGEAAHSERGEAFRQLRTNLRFVRIDEPVQVLVVTSSLPGEGKSVTAANLAAMFAEAGRSTLLIEADLRRPRVAEYLGLDRSVGLTDVLTGNAGLDEVTQAWGPSELRVLASGPLPPNPSELVGSHAMAELMQNLRSEFDMVIIDSPPLLPVTDAAEMAAVADGALVVVRSGRTTHPQVDSTVESLRAVDARLLGFVLNFAPVTRESRRYAQYDSDVSHYPPTGKHSKPRPSKALKSEPAKADQPKPDPAKPDPVTPDSMEAVTADRATAGTTDLATAAATDRATDAGTTDPSAAAGTTQPVAATRARVEPGATRARIESDANQARVEPESTRPSAEPEATQSAAPAAPVAPADTASAPAPPASGSAGFSLVPRPDTASHADAAEFAAPGNARVPHSGVGAGVEPGAPHDLEHDLEPAGPDVSSAPTNSEPNGREPINGAEPGADAAGASDRPAGEHEPIGYEPPTPPVSPVGRS
ncbi:polysaccharide biosynthesis tyrosine autokinase [Nakamurella aerolata]|uniref:non-specific protein-tyrosine kinase n=1 Tax=Nakamurella aerolata TaxID=1656892 RepID=A0A849A9R0_9ACTN|nr:polysaccharide biosynthesis tyrosine autokinase [Nakamurella aerolata]NNG35838.1 polysaccharide biosynthesis tyrosine autokinase [Nakamurella aerolata]